MGILTVSRQLGSGGDIIAKLVAQSLNWTLLDNTAFAKSAEEFGYVREELEQRDERGVLGVRVPVRSDACPVVEPHDRLAEWWENPAVVLVLFARSQISVNLSVPHH